MPEAPAEFVELRNLKRRLAEMRQTQLKALDAFHIDGEVQLTQACAAGGKVNGFVNVMPNTPPTSPAAHVSLTSTATCIRSLRLRPGINWPGLDFSNLRNDITSRYPARLVTTGLRPRNPYTLGQLVPVLKLIGFEKADAVVAGCLERQTSIVKRSGVSIQDFPPNGYLTYWCLAGLHAWGENVAVLGRKSIEWSSNELYRQISLFAGHDDEKSDAYQLGYNLLIQYRWNRTSLRDTVVSSALETLFGAQLPRGVWEKKDPLFVYGRAGDAYCFTFELLNSLLTDFRLDYPRLRPFETQLRRALGWVERNASLLGSSSEVRLWRSGHRVELAVADKPESWATAEVYSFLHLYGEFLAKRIQDIVLSRYRGYRPLRASPVEFDKRDQPTLQLGDDPAAEEPGLGTAQPLNRLLRTELLNSLEIPGGAETEFSLVRNADPKARNKSLIFTGPPRTGKSSAVTAMAEYLGWPLVILDPGDFAKDGLLMLPTMAANIFDELLELDDTVVFFDEMEELMRNRQEQQGSFEQRILTTSLLPKLQALRDGARCIFIVATNHFKIIDPAAAAPGRFDFRLKLLPRDTEGLPVPWPPPVPDGEGGAGEAA